MSSRMSTPLGRRSRKRRATRQGISDTATRLFFDRGFDQVTVDEIADAADVGRMTVFNHFPRKEDLFFDRDEEGREILQRALRDRDPAIAPIETLRRLAHRLVRERHPLVSFDAGSQAYVQAIEKSETLKARARGIRDELARVVAEALAESVGRAVDDPDAALAAGLLLATLTVALRETHRSLRHRLDEEGARALFLTIVDQGMAGVAAAVARTPYVEIAF